MLKNSWTENPAGECEVDLSHIHLICLVVGGRKGEEKKSVDERKKKVRREGRLRRSKKEMKQ